MSLYEDYQGDITFLYDNEFESFVKELEKNGYVKDGKFIDDRNKEDATLGSIDFQRKMVRLHGTFNKLHHTLNKLATVSDTDRLFKVDRSNSYAWKGKLVSTCEDGCFEGGVVTPEKSEQFCLYEYAQKIGYTDYTEDNNEDYEMREDIIHRFHEDPYWEKNSIKFIKGEK